MHNYLKTLDSIPRMYSIMKETAFFKITDEQKSHIDHILSKQQWTSGRCDGRKVAAYFNFHIVNDKFKTPGSE